MAKYRLYINDYNAWYGPEFINDLPAGGILWNKNMKHDASYELYGDSDYCFYFDSLDDAREMQAQLTEWGHPATIFQEIK